MSYASLMVYVDAVGTPEQRVRIAARLADKFKATLIGLSAHALHPPIVVDGVAMPEVTEAEMNDLREILARKEDWFRSVAGADRRTLEWRSAIDFPAQALLREARGADLVVIGRSKGPGDVYSALDPAQVILGLGRPALVVPDDGSGLRAEHVVIGWKDTSQARRAVRDALPMLHEAMSVTVCEICEPGEEDIVKARLADVVLYLDRHRIASRAVAIALADGTPAARLIQFVRDQGADLIVAGAYGHSRLGEWIFGGMTRDLLAASPFCCLMSH
jgi:nucleotide-binding universal stress UspA family protein